jgi:hypothetical protein
MGLDIYLHTAEHAAANRAHNEAANAHFERPDYESLTEEQRDAAYKALPPYAPHVDAASERYPSHLFNRRYLRSSYNGSGFNHAVPQLLGSMEGEYPSERGSLYWIFEPMAREWDGDDGNLTADDLDSLRASKARALEVAEELRKCDRLRVMTVSPNMFSAPPKTSDAEALRMYRKEVADGRIKADDWWGNAVMDVYGGGVSILAAVPGAATFGVPGVHLIYRPADGGVDSYIESAEIVAEFCDEAIALIERDGSCSMSWSG